MTGAIIGLCADSKYRTRLIGGLALFLLTYLLSDVDTMMSEYSLYPRLYRIYMPSLSTFKSTCIVS